MIAQKFVDSCPPTLRADQAKGPTLAAFLSSEHMSEATTALNADTGFSTAMANVDFGLQFNVAGTPEGDVPYYLQTAAGAATMALGELDGADASVSSDYDTAVAISKGELNVQMAFMTGKIKVGGNMAKIMMNQSLISEFARVQSNLELDF